MLCGEARGPSRIQLLLAMVFECYGGRKLFLTPRRGKLSPCLPRLWQVFNETRELNWESGMTV